MASFETFPLVVILLCVSTPCLGQITCIKTGAVPGDPCSEGQNVCRLGPQGQLLDDPCGTLQINCGKAKPTDKFIKCDPAVGCCCMDSNCNNPQYFSSKENTKELCKLRPVPKGVSCPTPPPPPKKPAHPLPTIPPLRKLETTHEDVEAAEMRAAQEAMRNEKSGCNSIGGINSLWTLVITIGMVAFVF